VDAQSGVSVGEENKALDTRSRPSSSSPLISLLFCHHSIFTWSRAPGGAASGQIVDGESFAGGGEAASNLRRARAHRWVAADSPEASRGGPSTGAGGRVGASAAVGYDNSAAGCDSRRGWGARHRATIAHLWRGPARAEARRSPGCACAEAARAGAAVARGQWREERAEKGGPALALHGCGTRGGWVDGAGEVEGERVREVRG